MRTVYLKCTGVDRYLSFETPDLMKVRDRIETIKHVPSRHCAKYLYLIDGRISEAVGRKAPSDKGSAARGPRGRDVSFQEYDGEEVALFNVYTSKREGTLRICALPLNSVYEPWTREIAEYFDRFDRDNHVFPFNRGKVWRECRSAWEGLVYPIENYKVIEVDLKGNVILNENGKKKSKTITRHTRPFNLHAIRHIRATDLVVYYGFNGPNLSAFAGWTLSTAMQVSSSINKYVSLDWRSYFHKLLKKRF